MGPSVPCEFRDEFAAKNLDENKKLKKGERGEKVNSDFRLLFRKKTCLVSLICSSHP